MLRGITLRALQGALALCMFAGPASATTYFGGTLVPNGVYLNFTAAPTSTGVVPAGLFSDTYQFFYTPPPGLLAATTTTNNNLSIPNTGLFVFNISNFRLQWVLEGLGGSTLVDTGAGNGVVTSLALPLPTPNGIGPTYVFDLILSGNATGLAGGVYNYTLITPIETPLPAALPLFATGLGVLAWAARRRKQKQLTA